MSALPPEPQSPEIHPLDEASPSGDQPGAMDELHQQRQVELERAARRRRWAQAVAAQAPAQTDLSSPPGLPTPEQESGQTMTMQAGVDLFRNVVSIPNEAIGGVLDAVEETRQFLSRGSSFEFNLRTREFTEKEVERILPEIEKSGTLTGSFARGLAKFLTGFAAAGKLQALQRLAQLGRAGAVAAPMIRAAISDFAVFDPQEERLSNLIEQVPALQNPVTGYLAADPNDGEAEGRFKNVVEGLGMGALTEGFTRGVRAIRSMRQAKAAAGLGDEVTRNVLERAQTQRKSLQDLVGDPEAKAFEIKEPPKDVTAGLSLAAEKGAIPGQAGATAAADRGELFVNWAPIRTHDDVKAMIQELANARAGNIKQGARGVRSWQATRTTAEQLDAWEVLQSRRVGQPLSADETVAVRELWVRSGARVRELAQRLNADPSDLNRIAFEKQWATHNAIQEQVIPARTETARALNSWAIPVGDAADFAGQFEQLKHLTEIPGARGVADELAKRITGMTDANFLKEADALLWGSRLANTSAMVRQSYYAAMLSSPLTHARNTIGNAAAVPLQMLERRFASMAGKAFGLQNVPDEEAASMLFGALSGFRRAFRFTAKGRKVFAEARKLRIAGDPEAAREMLTRSSDDIGTFFQSLTTGQSGFGMGKVEVPREGAFSQAAGDNAFARVARWMDTATTAPMRALTAEDEVFKTMNFDMELNAQAIRRANREVAEGTLEESAKQARVAELVANPDEYMRLAARDFAQISTFNQEPGKIAEGFAKLADAIPVLGRITLPFRTTPFNIATFTFRRTALAPFVRQWRADIMAGGAKADIAWSQFLVGNAILASMADLAIRGEITGIGPENPAERRTLRRQGWQANSIRVRTGGTDEEPIYRYFTYRNLEPLSAPIALAADVVDILKYQDWEDQDRDAEELVIASTMAIANQLTAQSYMSGLSGLMDAMSDPQRYGERWWERLVTTPIPRIVAQAARASDPTLRMATNLVDAMKAQTPGLSKTLPPAPDLWGRDIVRSSGLGSIYDLVSPIYSSSTENAEPIDKELIRNEGYISMPAKRLTSQSASISLRNRPEVWVRYVKLAGNELKLDVFGGNYGAKDALNALVSGKAGSASRMYDRLSDGPDGGKIMMIEDVVHGFREAAKQQLLKEYPELDAELGRRRSEKVQALQLQAR